jgi:transglutaminase-like putative cysteine protease
MKIQFGFALTYEFEQPTPMILVLNVHSSRASDLVQPDFVVTSPAVTLTPYRDGFGNWCHRLVSPPGTLRVSGRGIIHDSGTPEYDALDAPQWPVEHLPEETLVYLLGSRYCEADRLTPVAWQLFSRTELGGKRVQAICDFVHQHISFGYEFASPTKSAWEVFHEKRGVCRDYAHLAIAFCRCMNIPARYCTGYLGDIRIPAIPGPMDFAGWFEAYLGDRWYTFDARNNTPRVGRVLIARGRDACDVALSSTFGPNTLERFKVWTDVV